MMKPNWFDTEFATVMEKATAEQALEGIAKSPKLVQAVKKALDEHDANSKKQGWAGPSRTQAVRSAVAKVLQAD